MTSTKETVIRDSSNTTAFFNLLEIPPKFALSAPGENELLLFRGVDGGVIFDRLLDLIFHPVNRLICRLNISHSGRGIKFIARLSQDSSHVLRNCCQIHALKPVSFAGERGILGWQRWAQLVDKSLGPDRPAQPLPQDRN